MEMPRTIDVKFVVNDGSVTVTTDPDRSLLEILREELKLTGTKYGCGEGACGACAVLVDGKTVFSCSTVISEVAGKSIVTIEGLAKGDVLHPVQQAFLEEEAFQCGYCGNRNPQAKSRSRTYRGSDPGHRNSCGLTR